MTSPDNVTPHAHAGTHLHDGDAHQQLLQLEQELLNLLLDRGLDAQLGAGVHVQVADDPVVCVCVGGCVCVCVCVVAGRLVVHMPPFCFSFGEGGEWQRATPKIPLLCYAHVLPDSLQPPSEPSSLDASWLAVALT